MFKMLVTGFRYSDSAAERVPGETEQEATDRRLKAAADEAKNGPAPTKVFLVGMISIEDAKRLGAHLMSKPIMTTGVPTYEPIPLTILEPGEGVVKGLDKLPGYRAGAAVADVQAVDQTIGAVMPENGDDEEEPPEPEVLFDVDCRCKTIDITGCFPTSSGKHHVACPVNKLGS